MQSKMKSMKVRKDVYDRLDRFLTDEIGRTGNRRLTFSDAVELLLERVAK